MTIRFSRTACAVALSIAFSPAFAATDDEAVVIVTASRFLDVDRNTAANVVTITRDDIARLPVNNLPDLLGTAAGIEVRSLYGNQAADATATLRGFGENGQLRTLILIDGRRLDSLDFSSLNWNTIPLSSIDRIEIVRGSGAVLYGDQAVGGVINILTRHGTENFANVSATLGSFSTRKLSAAISKADQPLRVDWNLEHADSDEYRRRNATRTTSASGRLVTDIAGGEAYVEVGLGDFYYQLPGSVSASQFANDPRAAETNDSWFKREAALLRPGVRWKISDNLEAAVEMNLAYSRNSSWISNYGSYRDNTLSSVALTPRLRWSHGLGGRPSTTVFGFDWSDASLDSDQYANPSAAKTKTVSLNRSGGGLYVHNTTQATDSVTLTAGVRQQQFTTKNNDTGISVSAENTTSKTASELGAIWQVSPAWKTFLKLSTTFRYPVLDEFPRINTSSYQTIGFATPAPRPESGKGIDLGAEWRAGGHSAQVTLYDLKMTDEISYNALTGQNENLAKTTHSGIEVDTHWRLTRDWRLDLSAGSLQANFSEGINAGKTIPLVARQRATGGLSWLGGSFGTHSIFISHTGSRYFGGDDANALNKLPAYTSVDWQSRWRIASWDLSAKIINLTNKKYAPSGFDYGFGASYYPANPRSASLTATYNF